MLGVGVNKKIVNRLNVEMRTTNISNPFISIPFLKLGIRTGIEKNSKKYAEAYEQAQHCLSILQLIIKENSNI